MSFQNNISEKKYFFNDSSTPFFFIILNRIFFGVFQSGALLGEKGTSKPVFLIKYLNLFNNTKKKTLPMISKFF